MTTYARKLIAKELELGFLYIAAEARTTFPRRNDTVGIYLGDSTTPTSLSYNSRHHRLFGLTAWYRTNDARPGDFVEIEQLRSGAFRLGFTGGTGRGEYTEEEVGEILDLSGLSSMAKGDIVQDRIKEQILLFGQGLLSVYEPVTDSEGIDLIVVKNGVFQPIFLQVKGRFNLTRHGAFLCDIRMKTFNPHHSYYVVGAYFDPVTLELHERLVFVPTEVVEREGTKVHAAGDLRYRITTSLAATTQSKWAPYICTKQELVNHILAKFEEIERYLR